MLICAVAGVRQLPGVTTVTVMLWENTRGSCPPLTPLQVKAACQVSAAAAAAAQQKRQQQQQQHQWISELKFLKDVVLKFVTNNVWLHD
jgi:hypothetical protein